MPDLIAVDSAPHDRRIRVLLTTPTMTGRGGVSQYWRVLRSHLGDDVRYFTIGSRSDHESFETILLRIVQDSLRFARTLIQGDFDIVHLNPSILPKALVRDGILLLVAKALRKKVLVFAHGWNPAWDRAFPKYWQCAFRVVYGRADAFVVLGSRFKRKMRMLGYDKKVFVERAPVADELLDDADHELTERFAKSGGRFNILFLARVEREKGIYEALDAYWLLKQRHPFVSLTVAGEGSELIEARRYARSRGVIDVSFVGHVEGSEKCNVFRMASAYLFPSHHEGLPLSVLEAMAFGLPVVTCNVGGLSDFFEAGIMGFITESREPEVLASLLNRLISDPILWSNIRQFNRNYALNNFTARQMANRIGTIYRVLLGIDDEEVVSAE